MYKVALLRHCRLVKPLSFDAQRCSALCQVVAKPGRRQMKPCGLGWGGGVQAKVMLNCNVKVTTVMQLLTGFTLRN